MTSSTLLSYLSLKQLIPNVIEEPVVAIVNFILIVTFSIILAYLITYKERLKLRRHAAKELNILKTLHENQHIKDKLMYYALCLRFQLDHIKYVDKNQNKEDVRLILLHIAM